MTKVFISYRRDDSGYAATAIYERLVSEFSAESIFFDVDSIPPGVDFRDHLSDAVNRCDVFLAIIGDNWLESRYDDGPLEGQRRLDDPKDFVRIEIEAALSRHIPLVPVLVSRASMPKERNLPGPLGPLAYLNAIEIRSGRDFAHNVQRLIKDLRNLETSSDARWTSLTRKIFLCYSTRDRDVADSLERTLRATGDTFLRNLTPLGAGTSWDQHLMRLIDEADIFILLWSNNAAASEFTKREWQYAESLHRPYFIRPVYFQDPLPPPPEELAHLHFLRLH